MITVITIRYVFLSIYICFCFTKNNFSSSGKSSQTSHVSFQHSDISHRIPLTLNWRRLSYPCVSIAANLRSSPSYSTVQIYFFFKMSVSLQDMVENKQKLLARVIYFLLQRFLLFKVILRTFSSVAQSYLTLRPHEPQHIRLYQMVSLSSEIPLCVL